MVVNSSWTIRPGGGTYNIKAPVRTIIDVIYPAVQYISFFRELADSGRCPVNSFATKVILKKITLQQRY